MSESFEFGWPDPDEQAKDDEIDQDEFEAQRLLEFLEDETATTLRFVGDTNDPNVRRLIEVIRSHGFDVVIPGDN